MTATLTRKKTSKPATKPATRPATAITWDHNPLTGILFIDRDGVQAGYFCDVTLDGVVLTKLADRRTVYCVTVEDVARCNCRGYAYHGHCKHTTVCSALIEEGAI
jgi:hypothetical protein